MSIPGRGRDEIFRVNGVHDIASGKENGRCARKEVARLEEGMTGKERADEESL